MNITCFNSIFDSTATTLSLTDFLICLFVSLGIGLFLAAVYSFRTRYTQSFFGIMVLLPAIVCVVIMLVNGNVGAGVAVAGAFSLVRFRSVPADLYRFHEKRCRPEGISRCTPLPERKSGNQSAQ